jgi:DNA-binding transcriptional ArsR family regulator
MMFRFSSKYDCDMMDANQDGDTAMHFEPDLAAIAALIGDPARSTILSALLGGQSLPASELAHRAHVTAQTTSTHLAKLVEGGLLEVNRIGRHRYYRLKNAEVAHALEALAIISPAPRIKSQHESAEYHALCFARTCYDHLAGKLGVMMIQVFLDRGLLTLDDQSYALTAQGSKWLNQWNIDENQLRKGRRMFARTCLDWSERRSHLAGALGAAITNRLFENGWITRTSINRAVHLTEEGRLGFLREFELETIINL